MLFYFLMILSLDFPLIRSFLWLFPGLPDWSDHQRIASLYGAILRPAVPRGPLISGPAWPRGSCSSVFWSVFRCFHPSVCLSSSLGPEKVRIFVNFSTDSWNFAPNPDKQWLLQRTGKMEPVHVAFTDQAHRRRLQTLQSVDDAVQRVR